MYWWMKKFEIANASTNHDSTFNKDVQVKVQWIEIKEKQKKCEKKF
jgi:hypothetical protein